MAKKIKAINPVIIVSGDVDKPYFQIRYYGIADNTYRFGFGSYDYSQVLRWLEEYFEPIEADETPVTHGWWVDVGERYDDYDECFYSVFKCSNCGITKEEYPTSNYCPNCGAKMDGR